MDPTINTTTTEGAAPEIGNESPFISTDSKARIEAMVAETMNYVGAKPAAQTATVATKMAVEEEFVPLCEDNVVANGILGGLLGGAKAILSPVGELAGEILKEAAKSEPWYRRFTAATFVAPWKLL